MLNTKKQPKKIRTKFPILNLCAAGDFIFLSNGEHAELYQLFKHKDKVPEKQSSWDKLTHNLCSLHILPRPGSAETYQGFLGGSLLGERADIAPLLVGGEDIDIILARHSSIFIYNKEGTLKSKISIQEEEEGFPIAMDCKHHLLAVVSFSVLFSISLCDVCAAPQQMLKLLSWGLLVLACLSLELV